MNRHLLFCMLAAASLPAFADYEVNFPDGTRQTPTNPQRVLNGVTFRVGNLPAQYVADGDDMPGSIDPIINTAEVDGPAQGVPQSPHAAPCRSAAPPSFPQPPMAIITLQ